MNKGEDMNSFIAELKKEHTRFLKMKAAKEAAQRANDAKVFKKLSTNVDTSNDCDNINRWTDESAYAKQYYGSVFKETTRFDSEWD